VRSGGFGGDAGFEAWLDQHPVRAVIDATHPFATRITRRTARICAARGLPCLRLERPGWTAGPDDHWMFADDVPAALALLPPGARTFCATGRQSLPDLGRAPGPTFLRVIDPPQGPYPHAGDWVIARPPFDTRSEAALFRRLGISHLLVKDSGGDDSRTKLEAARLLHLPVLMIRRPPPGPGACVHSAAAAMDWLTALPPSSSPKYPGGPGAAPPGPAKRITHPPERA
jgi:precorrin-6A/cobalt-precorrin-6A reductase